MGRWGAQNITMCLSIVTISINATNRAAWRRNTEEIHDDGTMGPRHSEPLTTSVRQPVPKCHSHDKLQVCWFGRQSVALIPFTIPNSPHSCPQNLGFHLPLESDKCCRLDNTFRYLGLLSTKTHSTHFTRILHYVKYPCASQWRTFVNHCGSQNLVEI